MSGSLYTYVTSTGVIVSDTSTILAEVQTEYQGALGAGLNTDTSTPQGVLISSETTARQNVIQSNTALANQINPNQAQGVFLDAICALTGLTRAADTYTTVPNVTLTGVGNTPIPAGSFAATTAGDTFALSSSVTLSAGGTSTTGTFIAVEPGPVPCGTGTLGLTEVVSNVLGWETVSNASSAIIGTAEQSDESLRALRRQTLYLQGVSLMGASLSALAALPGVIGVQGLENTSSSAATISGISMTANSIWFCVDGGSQASIGTALLQNKSMGCAWNGAQSVTLIEPSSNQSYTVHYDVPTLVPISCNITVAQGSFSGNLQSSVIQALLDFASNNIQPSNPNDVPIAGFSVGQSASPFEMAAGVLQECPGAYIQTLQIALSSGGTFAASQIAMAINQKATLSEGNIAVTVVT